MERNNHLVYLRSTAIVALLYVFFPAVTIASPDSSGALEHSPISEVVFGGDTRAEYEESGVEFDSWDPNAIQPASKYLQQQTVYKGKLIDKIVVPGRPPKFFRMSAVDVPHDYATQGIVVLPNVPAFNWSYGCSATSAAMIMGYYDNMGYSNMYAGPANGGVCPPNNATWGYGECPLSATHLGYDGLGIKGHVDDYWRAYGNNTPDPYIGFWSEHEWADCTADYMGTNQSKYGNSDGSTTFWYFTDGSPIYDYAGGEPSGKDGCHGIGEFARSRGYQVAANFSQYIYGYNGNTSGFTFDQYKNEIDKGRPVMIQVSGHSMVGYGYDSANQTVYIHDTWDHNNHTMTWSGQYAGMQHYGVTVMRLVSIEQPLKINQPYEYYWNAGQAVSDSLNATGGTQPYHNWIAFGGANNYTYSVLRSSLYNSVGISMGWKADDDFWSYSLPFAFPYYGSNYTSVNPCSNGFLRLNGADNYWDNSSEALASSNRIAPLWDDLKTTDGDIYVDESVSGQVTFRWDSVTWSGSYPANFTTVLFNDGRIRFDYGAGNTGLTPTVGISSGDTVTSIDVPGYSNSSNLTNAKSVLFTPITTPLPPGINLDTVTGVFSGIPNVPGDYYATIKVDDSAILTQTTQQTFIFHVARGYTLSTTVKLGDYSGLVQGIPVKIELRGEDGITILRTENTSLDAQSKLYIDNVQPGTYYVGIKPSHWLKKVTGPVIVNNMDVDFVIQ